MVVGDWRLVAFQNTGAQYFERPEQLTKELSSEEFREGDIARPVGEGKYAIVSHHNKHTELAFVLELPEEPGEAQKELVLRVRVLFYGKTANSVRARDLRQNTICNHMGSKV